MPPGLPTGNVAPAVCDDQIDVDLVPDGFLAVASERTTGFMTQRQRTATAIPAAIPAVLPAVLPAVVAGLAGVVGILAGAGPAAAEPAEPAPIPAPIYPAEPPPLSPEMAAMTPDQAAVPQGDPAAPPPPPAGPPGVPEIPNPTYGSGDSGGGVFGTLKDIMKQVQNPYFTAEELMGSGLATAPPPGAGPAPELPPGYVSINNPGGAVPPVPATGPYGGSVADRPTLPEGYYRLDGPPPPWYSDPDAEPPAPISPGT